jgi:hypothetical protein
MVSPTAAMVTEAEAAAGFAELGLDWAEWAEWAGAVELAGADDWPAVVCTADEQAARPIPPTATAAIADFRSFTGKSWRPAGRIASIPAAMPETVTNASGDLAQARTRQSPSLLATIVTALCRSRMSHVRHHRVVRFAGIWIRDLPRDSP